MNAELETTIYEQIVSLFKKEMIKQLDENKRKGDRAGWLSCSPMQIVLEIYYHTGKLQQAVKDNNIDLIKEYSADVANMAMMALDASGGLLPFTNEPVINAPNTFWIKNVVT